MPISADSYRRIGRASAGAVSVVAAYDHAAGDTIVAHTVEGEPLLYFARQFGKFSALPA